MEEVLKNYPESQYAVFLTNHDQDRVMSQLEGDEARAKLAATLLLTSPGVPFIYYGEEIGMTGVKPDEDIRLPMKWSDGTGVGFTSGRPWRAPSKDHPDWNVLDSMEDPASLLSHYRNLIHLRNQHPALRTGKAVLVETDTARLYALLRYNQEEAFLILVNVHPKPLTLDLYNLNLPAGLPFKGPVQAISIWDQTTLTAPQITPLGGFQNYRPFIEIPAASSLIIHLKP